MSSQLTPVPPPSPPPPVQFFQHSKQRSLTRAKVLTATQLETLRAKLSSCNENKPTSIAHDPSHASDSITPIASPHCSTLSSSSSSSGTTTAITTCRSIISSISSSTRSRRSSNHSRYSRNRSRGRGRNHERTTSRERDHSPEWNRRDGQRVTNRDRDRRRDRDVSNSVDRSHLTASLRQMQPVSSPPLSVSDSSVSAMSRGVNSPSHCPLVADFDTPTSLSVSFGNLSNQSTSVVRQMQNRVIDLTLLSESDDNSDLESVIFVRQKNRCVRNVSAPHHSFVPYRRQQRNKRNLALRLNRKTGQRCRFVLTRRYSIDKIGNRICIASNAKIIHTLVTDRIIRKYSGGKRTPSVILDLS